VRATGAHPREKSEDRGARFPGAGWAVVCRSSGLPCAIEFEQDELVVTFASTTIARAARLETAIVRACGGLVSPLDARALAAPVAGQAPRKRRQ
jgi:hypothetical protein